MNEENTYYLDFSEKEATLQAKFYAECLKCKIECYLEPTIKNKNNPNKVSAYGSIDIVVKIKNKLIGLECKKSKANDYYSHKKQLLRYRKLNIPIVFFKEEKHILPIIYCLRKQNLLNKIHIYDEKYEVLVMVLD